MKRKQLFVEIVIALLVLLFVYTGSDKLLNRAIFSAQLAQSPWDLLKHNRELFSWIVPILELVVALLILLKKTKTIGLLMAGIAMLSFTLYVGIMLGTHQHLPCSCGGIIRYLSWSQHLIFNSIFTILSFVVFYLSLINMGFSTGNSNVENLA
ncbi:hypothetical protein LX64_01817 [Chitinophaga skermanii]|uniref:Methylamine utilisation protein MauE domain-containing protein n=1 Tax=Chitinophaga skermanii TaxID=331697 RepID=A0A327QQS8_9BACT|nr:MauE/DoxX family redox-associated membrane protein [Chitinophaga skermanii]RAJ06690.1 hypothetical protein LX64_01817 [Chitinophaga skermanii]